ncbi:MAG TPA: hypothetical protein VMR86_12450 [Myxococcota bacterium]|nr:hypothetical protein [Myxococcota bacterium]
MKTLVRLLSAAALLALAGRASALVIVDYAFSDQTDSSLAITSPVQVSIPPGTIDGLIRVTYTSDSQGNIQDGPATLDVLNMDAGLDVSSSFLNQPFTLTGPVSAHLLDPVDGELSGTQLSFGNAPGDFHAFGTITCTGTPCGAVHLPSGTPVPFDGTGSVSLPVLTLGSIHGTLTGLTFTVGSASIVATLTINGDETGRQIPEPAAAALLTLAGSLLALRGRRRP